MADMRTRILPKMLNSEVQEYLKRNDIITLLPKDDAASVNMGGFWHMPSKEQLDELINSSYTTTTWTTVNGIKGRLITSKTNNNTLFLPASGYCDWGGVGYVGSNGYYWSSSLDTEFPGDSGYLFFSSGSIVGRYNSRYFGYMVRGVVG